MKIAKHIAAPLEKSYAVRRMVLNGREKWLFASEVDAACICFDAETLDSETVWENDGGTMGMVPFPHSENSFLAIRGFYPPFLAKGSGLVLVQSGKTGFTVKPWLELPYLHRFGVVETDRGCWLVLSVLCETKNGKDDWSSPGYVAVSPLVDGLPGKLVRILEGQYHNHGFFSGTFRGRTAVLIASDAGVTAIYPPAGKNTEWTTEKLSSEPAGEIWPYDMDGDGKEELVTLEAFHGNSLKVRHLDANGSYAVDWSYPEPLNFAHPLWAGELWGRIRGIAGSRRDDAPLFLFWYENGKYKTELIEKGASSANVTVGERHGKQCILSCNHGRNECAYYTNEDE